MYRSSPLRSTLNTNVITGLDMCKVCTKCGKNVDPESNILPDWKPRCCVGWTIYAVSWGRFSIRRQKHGYGQPKAQRIQQNEKTVLKNDKRHWTKHTAIRCHSQINPTCWMQIYILRDSYKIKHHRYSRTKIETKHKVPSKIQETKEKTVYLKEYVFGPFGETLQHC